MHGPVPHHFSSSRFPPAAPPHPYLTLTEATQKTAVCTKRHMQGKRWLYVALKMVMHIILWRWLKRHLAQIITGPLPQFVLIHAYVSQLFGILKTILSTSTLKKINFLPVNSGFSSPLSQAVSEAPNAVSFKSAYHVVQGCCCTRDRGLIFSFSHYNVTHAADGVKADVL